MKSFGYDFTVLPHEISIWELRCRDFQAIIRLVHISKILQQKDHSCPVGIVFRYVILLFL